MKTIWKYPLFVGDNVFEMPIGAWCISASTQDDQLYLWAVVEPGQYKESRRISVRGTGWETKDEPGGFIDTVQIGPMVWHVFDRGTA